MNIFKTIEDKIEAAKPHAVRGLKRADYYACRIIALLEEIARDDAVIENQRVKRFNLTNGQPAEFETPQGEDWNMVAFIVEPAAATTITLKLGGVTRFAKQFAAADTPQVPGVVISSGSTFTVLATGADAVVTIIASLKRKRPRVARGEVGDQFMPGFPGANEFDIDRHFTDEATVLGAPPTSADELALVDEGDTVDRNAEPVL